MFRIVLCDDSPADLMVLCGHLEQLKEKRLKEFKAEQLIEEQKELDEIGLQIHARAMR